MHREETVTLGYSSAAADSIFLRYLIENLLPHVHNMKDGTSSLTNIFLKNKP